MKIECEFCHTVFEAEAPKEFGDTSRGVIQVLVCTYCGLVKPLARISHDGVKMRDLMNLLRDEGKPVPKSWSRVIRRSSLRFGVQNQLIFE